MEEQKSRAFRAAPRQRRPQPRVHTRTDERPGEERPGEQARSRSRIPSTSARGSEQQRQQPFRGGGPEGTGTPSSNSAAHVDATDADLTGSFNSLQMRSKLQQQGSPKRRDERPREGSQRCKYYSETTLERVSVGVAAVAGRGSDRVGAEAGTVLADREKVATTACERNRRHPPQIDVIEISSSPRVTHQTRTSHDDPDQS